MVQNFCRHNRFIQRCPICRETVPGFVPPVRPAKSGSGSAVKPGAQSANPSSPQGRAASPLRGMARGASRGAREVHVRREARAEDDGYRCELVPGLRSSFDAERLVEEIGFSAGRLLMLTAAPPGVYGEARDCEDIEQATWMCFVCAYLSPLQGVQPFAGIRQALVHSWRSGGLPDLEDVPLGPRSSHDSERGAETLLAYRRFAEHAGSQERAFAGEPEWTPQRRFARVFERLALPGFGREGRYDLLIALGRLGLYELRADSLHLSTRSVRTPAGDGDRVLEAAKRVFGIGDHVHLQRRAQALAEEIETPIEALDLALWNWSLPSAEERATLGFQPDTRDAHAVERALTALEL
jgi:alpha-glutamyl/putrescinyl thymine pyrophosphorylase-like protein